MFTVLSKVKFKLDRKMRLLRARLGLGFGNKISLGAYLQGLRNSLIVTSFVVDCPLTLLELLYWQESFNLHQLEKMLDNDNEFAALLKLEVNSFGN